MNKWYTIENKSSETPSIYIYEQIGEDFWADGIGAKEFVGELADITAKSIDLHINSPGGNVFDGNAIYNALMQHKATINVKIDGIAASIASVIAMSGDTIEMPENAMMMIHDPSGVVIGTATDMNKMASALDKIKSGLVSAYRDKSKMDDAKIIQMMTDETWLTAKEAVGFGLADKMTEKINVQACATMQIFNRMFKKVPEHIALPVPDLPDPLPENKKGLRLKLLQREFESRRCG